MTAIDPADVYAAEARRQNRRGPALEHVAPHNRDAEKALLGSLLIDATRMHDVQRLLPGPQAFFFDRHRIVYDVCTRLLAAGKPFDGVLIRERLESENRFDEIGGYDTLAGLATSVGSAARAVEYAELVRDCWLRREALAGAHRLMNCAVDPAQTASGTLTLARRIVDELTDKLPARDQAGCDELVESVFAELDSGPTRPPLTTALADLDEVLIGLKPGHLTVVGGLRSSGKSALGVHLAQAVAFGQSLPTLFFALEPRMHDVMLRLLAMHACIDSRDLAYNRSLTAAESERLQAVRRWLSTQRMLRFDETPGMRISQLVAACRADSARRSTRLVVIDQLSHIGFDSQTRYERYDLSIGQITRTLKMLAKELQLTVVLLVQLNRASEKDDREPRMSDLRDSAQIEHDADQILLLHSPDPTGTCGEDSRPARHGAAAVKHYLRHIIVAKNRDGQTALGDEAVKVAWVPAWQQFRNYAGSAGYAVARPEPESQAVTRAIPPEALKGTDAFWGREE